MANFSQKRVTSRDKFGLSGPICPARQTNTRLAAPAGLPARKPRPSPALGSRGLAPPPAFPLGAAPLRGSPTPSATRLPAHATSRFIFSCDSFSRQLLNQTEEPGRRVCFLRSHAAGGAAPVYATPGTRDTLLDTEMPQQTKPSPCPRGSSILLFIYLFIFGLFLSFLRPHPSVAEVPRLGVQLELQLPAYPTATADPSLVFNRHRSPRQHRLLNPLSKAGLEPVSSWNWSTTSLLTTEPRRELRKRFSTAGKEQTRKALVPNTEEEDKARDQGPSGRRDTFSGQL